MRHVFSRYIILFFLTPFLLGAGRNEMEAQVDLFYGGCFSTPSGLVEINRSGNKHIRMAHIVCVRLVQKDNTVMNFTITLLKGSKCLKLGANKGVNVFTTFYPSFKQKIGFNPRSKLHVEEICVKPL